MAGLRLRSRHYAQSRRACRPGQRRLGGLSSFASALEHSHGATVDTFVVSRCSSNRKFPVHCACDPLFHVVTRLDYSHVHQRTYRTTSYHHLHRFDYVSNWPNYIQYTSGSIFNSYDTCNAIVSNTDVFRDTQRQTNTTTYSMFRKSNVAGCMHDSHCCSSWCQFRTWKLCI